jgi:cell division topological specificity factor
MLQAIRRFFGEKGSGHVARDRMQFVLMHDRMDVTPDIMESLKNDIMQVLSRYMDIDQKSVNVTLERGKDYTALISNVHIKKVLRKC